MAGELAMVPVRMQMTPMRAGGSSPVRVEALPMAPLRREGHEMSSDDARHGLARVGQVGMIAATAAVALPVSDAVVEMTSWCEATRAAVQGVGLCAPGAAMVFGGYMPEVGAGLFVAGFVGGMRRGVRAMRDARLYERARAWVMPRESGYVGGLPSDVTVEARVG